MKNNTQPKFYFSAYPLKVIGTTNDTNGATAETNLKVSTPKIVDGVLKILPVSNSHSKKFIINTLPGANATRDMENHDVSWYNNYE